MISNNTTKKGFFANQIALKILFVMLLISLVSGIHRTLISLLTAYVNGSTTETFTADSKIPLIIWLQLGFSVAPFGLAKAIADYSAGRLSIPSRKRVMFLGAIFYLIGIVFIIISILLTMIEFPSSYDILINYIKIIALPLGTSGIGAGEGFFYAAAQISLSYIASGRSRGIAMGASEFTIYGGYTIGGIIGGIFAGTTFFTSYIVALGTIILTISLTGTFIKDTNSVNDSISKNKHPDPVNKDESQSTKPPSFKARRLLRKIPVLSLFVGAHLSKFGDAFIWVLPIFLGLRFTIGSSLTPDTATIGFLLGMYTAIWAITMLVASRLSDIFGRRALTIIGFTFSGLGIIAIVSIPTNSSNELLLYFLAFALAGLGTGLYYPVLPAIGLDIVVQRIAGETLALLRAIRDFGYFTGVIFILAIAYISGSTVESLRISGLITGGILIMLALLFIVLLRETRPSWRYFDNIVMHANTVSKSVENSIKSFDRELWGNSNQVKSFAMESKEFERIADVLKRDIRSGLLSQSIRGTEDVTEFLSLIRTIDRIAGRAATASLKYSKICDLNIPQPVRLALVELSNSVLPLMNQLIFSLQLLDEQLPLSIKQSKEIIINEEKTDQAYDIYLQKLFSHEHVYPETERFTLMMTLKEIGDLLEDSADQMENAADLISVIAMKHKL